MLSLRDSSRNAWEVSKDEVLNYVSNRAVVEAAESCRKVSASSCEASRCRARCARRTRQSAGVRFESRILKLEASIR